MTAVEGACECRRRRELLRRRRVRWRWLVSSSGEGAWVTERAWSAAEGAGELLRRRKEGACGSSRTSGGGQFAGGLQVGKVRIALGPYVVVQVGTCRRANLQRTAPGHK